MEKQGIIKPGVTPTRDEPGEKKAQPTVETLDNDITKRLADAAAKPPKSEPIKFEPIEMSDGDRDLLRHIHSLQIRFDNMLRQLALGCCVPASVYRGSR